MVMNDSRPLMGAQSTITSSFVVELGLHLITVSIFVIDPADEFGLAIWANYLFEDKHAPDGVA